MPEPIPAARRVHPLRSTGFPISPRFTPPDHSLGMDRLRAREPISSSAIAGQAGGTHVADHQRDVAPPNRPMLLPSLRRSASWSAVVTGTRRTAYRAAAPRRPPARATRNRRLTASRSSRSGRARGQQKPDAAIILTGQTFGLLQPCGCSRPQKGGLERRMQFITDAQGEGLAGRGRRSRRHLPGQARRFTSSTRFSATRRR